MSQPDLATTYQTIADKGVRNFYEGPFADTVGRWMDANGGALTASDLARYRPVVREPIVSTYRGHTILGFGPPSSGGVHVAQILNILEHFDLRSLFRHDPASCTHVIAEAMKLAFADRAHWLGDPAFTYVPRGLIEKRYAKRLAQRIDLEAVTASNSHGVPEQPAPFPAGSVGKGHTTHIATADAEGNWVAITATINTSFGSGVIVPGTGVVLNNEMDDFAAAPGVPNAFGLIGAEANAVAPMKRPLSSMSPTIVMNGGRPVMTVGAAGGPRIITQAVLAIVRTVDFDWSLNRAVTEPRFHHQWRPDVLFVESGTQQSVIDGLRRRGHNVRTTTRGGVTQAIRWDDWRGFTGVADPRVDGLAEGW